MERDLSDIIREEEETKEGHHCCQCGYLIPAEDVMSEKAMWIAGDWYCDMCL